MHTDNADAQDEDCPLCRGLRGHKRLRQSLSEEAMPMYEALLSEQERLKDLFSECVSYMLVLSAYKYHMKNQTSWNYMGPLYIHMLGTRVEHFTRNGHEREACVFPIYFSGFVSEAVPVPVEICWNELQEVKELVEYWKDAVTAPYDWAPGGSKYRELLQSTVCTTVFSNKNTTQNVKRDSSRKRDRLEQEVGPDT